MNAITKLYNLYRLNVGPAPAGESGSVPANVFAPAPSRNAITPYLGLRSRLSQVWINRWTILLFLVLVRTLFAIASIQEGIQDAKQQALSSCNAVESVGSALASAPHYMARGVNELTASGVEKAIDGLWDMLLMTVTGVEEIVLFVINLLTSTYVCLITLVISGSLHAAIALIEDAQNFLNSTLGDIGKDIQSSVSSFQSSLNSLDSGLDKIPEAFGSSSTIPTLNITGDLTKLNNLQLPGSLDADLTKLNNSIPTFPQVQNATNSVIQFPFEEIKKLINGSHGNYTFDRNAFPVPPTKQLTFCSDNDGINDFFQGLYDIEVTARSITIAVLTIMAVLACIPMAYRELRRWRMMEARARLASTRAYDTLDVIYIGSRPYTSLVGIKLSDYSNVQRRQTLIRWFIAYATSEPALFLLSLAVAGLFTCLCHWLVLNAVVKEAPALAEQVEAFADKVVNSLEDASVQWAKGTNSAILDMNNKINNDIFGWVNSSTSAVNATLNTFSDEMTDALNTTFGGTVLYQPITEVFNCLIGLKISGIEKGLTWVQDNAHINFPLLPNNTFSLEGLANNTNSSQAASILNNPQQGSSDGITKALTYLVNKVDASIRKEIIVSVALLAAWVALVLGGAARAVYLAFSNKAVSTAPDVRRSVFAQDIDALRTGEKGSVDDGDFVDPRAVPSPPNYAATPPIPQTVEKQGASSDNSGQRFNGQDYTLKPRPFPSFSVPMPGAGNEKCGP